MIARAMLLTTALVCAAGAQTIAHAAPIRITADLSEAPRRLYHAEVDIPVKAGPLTLTTPQWIPGTHQPEGPVDNITGVFFTANGQTLPWRRDDVDIFQFHMTIPKGVTTLHAHLDCIVTARVSNHIAVLEWEKLLLYPAGLPVAAISIEPSVTVLAGWGMGTALTAIGAGTPPPGTGLAEQDHQSAQGSVTTHYAATTVEQLEDSPVIAGEFFHEFPLAPEMTPKHFIDVVADVAEDVNLRPALLAQIENLVREANAAYGSHHYNTYHFLLTLSDVAGGEGLEHGQSSDNGGGEKSFAAPSNSDLLAHEYTHSWNGKYRRPAGLYQPDFATPQRGAMLWVYEGMTQYMGNVLSARSGLRTKAQYLNTIASNAAQFDFKAGRQWRSTEDTGIATSVLRGRDAAWSNWRRGQDYYGEGALLWLDTDTKIRQLTDGKKSLTDFQRIFLGKGGNTGPLIVPFDRDELVRDLNEVVGYDWAEFLHQRVDIPNARADLDGIEQGGYKLVYLDHPPSDRGTGSQTARTPMGPDVWYSLGLRIAAAGARVATPEGTISDVLWGGPADDAKLSPGQRIVAINGRTYSADVLLAAIRDAKGKTEPIRLIVEREGTVTTVDLSYHGGERYPALERIEGTPDYLSDIAKPLVAVPANAVSPVPAPANSAH